ncbi:amino acid/polyamine transporter I [Gigaspora rosea]|uniref:Amino acid/polyamine transporter I n=1 Tax=Gigaspora rosea TaxID=44941 RepID=A0A397VQZ2_9GLOM|nr:amino acid/polyamine transporter I [Gigaspora rosea]
MNMDMNMDEEASENTANQINFEKILGITGGVTYNINEIIGSGIFLTPGNVWRLTKSPGITLIFWIVGGLFSFLGSSVYALLSEMLPDGAGELLYLDEAFPKPKRIIAQIFSHAMIFVMRPASIVADSYATSQYILFAIRGESGDYLDPKGYFSKDFIIIRCISIAVLTIITLYHIRSSRLAARINIIFAAVKILALSVIIIVGLIQLHNVNLRSHWTNIFNNTVSDQRTFPEQVGSYGDAMLQVLFAYEGWNNVNYLTDELVEPNLVAKSNNYSVGIAFILYVLTNVAYITVVNPEDAVIRDDPSQIIAINFGKALIGETGKRIISILIAISSCGAVAAMIYSGSRIIVYGARKDLIACSKFYELNERYNTPINALLFQLAYCIILTIFFPTIWNIFLFFITTSLYLTILYHGVSAISLVVLQNKFPTIVSCFKATILCVSFLILIILMAIVTFFPLPATEDRKLHYIPYVIAWSAIILGGIIPYLYGKFGNRLR